MERERCGPKRGEPSVDPTRPWPDFDRLDPLLAAEFGRSPTDTDGLSLYELAVMEVGAISRRRERVQTVGLVLDGLFNYSGFATHPLEFGHHARQMLGGRGGLSSDDAEAVRALAREHRDHRKALGLA